MVMTFNRPTALARCLQSLVAQCIGSHTFEVVLVDVSQPPVNHVVEAFAEQLLISHRIAANQGVAGNRNLGAESARGSLLVYLDDDCVADPYWLEAILQAAKRYPDRMIGGRVNNLHPESLVACVSQLITEAVDATFNPPGSEPKFFAGLNFAVPRKDYLTLGGCDVTYGRLAAEDRDFCRRWRASGRYLVKASDAVVIHEHRKDLNGFWRQYFNYGRGAYRFSKEKDSMKTSTTISKHLRLIQELKRILCQSPGSQRPVLMMLLVVWEVANTAGFIWKAAQDILRRR
ncbi:glycosyltransferase [Nostoc sp. NMS7]|uniref:glycosyltransferase family 2 protein n=1 Tax=Nostoc sp. NMS7 TaxID=2815391 RepID=UPI003459F30D